MSDRPVSFAETGQSALAAKSVLNPFPRIEVLSAPLGPGGWPGFAGVLRYPRAVVTAIVLV